MFDIDLMDHLEEDLAPQIAANVSVAGCAEFAILTRRAVEEQTYAPTDEVVQQLTIAADGQVQFRANTYHNGPGRFGIGRVTEASISRAAVQEIGRMLDTWLYTRADAEWQPSAGQGVWYLRVRQADGREQIQRGPLDGAFVAGMDLSWFIRERVPVEGLFLFDQSL